MRKKVQILIRLTFSAEEVLKVMRPTQEQKEKQGEV